MTGQQTLWQTPPATEKAVRCAACIGTGYLRSVTTMCKPCLGRGWMNWRPAVEGELSLYERTLNHEVRGGE